MTGVDLSIGVLERLSGKGTNPDESVLCASSRGLHALLHESREPVDQHQKRLSIEKETSERGDAACRVSLVLAPAPVLYCLLFSLGPLCDTTARLSLSSSPCWA